MQYNTSGMPEHFKVLLYYKYVHLDDPERIRAQQRELCERLGIKGRILLAHEGINGTVAGAPDKIDQYVVETTSFAPFNDIEWKVSWASEQIFPKLKVKVRDEIVTLGVKKTGKDVAIEHKANYIEPEELLALYESGEDFIILDARNVYEAEVGKFKNAIIPPIDNFRDFAQYVDSIKEYQDKQVVTYCTGGIRCEKASAYLREHGFQNVRQLHGGIHEYGRKAKGKHFEGEMFVFDKRLHVPVNEINPSVVSACTYCHQKVTRYIDCTSISCPSLFICCETCEKKYQGTCSAECLAQVTHHHHPQPSLVATAAHAPATHAAG